MSSPLTVRASGISVSLRHLGRGGGCAEEQAVVLSDDLVPAPGVAGVEHITHADTLAVIVAGASSPKPKTAIVERELLSRSRGPAPTPFTGARAAINFVLDTAGTARNTQYLLDLLAPTKPAGVPLTQSELARGFGRFPVHGYVWHQNDCGAPRYEPYFHLHEGVDLFAVAGTPVIACAEGVIPKLADGSIGRISFLLDGDDGITYCWGSPHRLRAGYGRGEARADPGRPRYVGATGVAVGTYPLCTSTCIRAEVRR